MRQPWTAFRLTTLRLTTGALPFATEDGDRRVLETGALPLHGVLMWGDVLAQPGGAHTGGRTGAEGAAVRAQEPKCERPPRKRDRKWDERAERCVMRRRQTVGGGDDGKSWESCAGRRAVGDDVRRREGQRKGGGRGRKADPVNSQGDTAGPALSSA